MKQALKSITAAITAAQSILSVDEEVFALFTKFILSKPGTLFVSGVGKSGLVAQKFAGTLSSIGFQVAFIDPLEFVHGGAGRIALSDSVLVISKSGDTKELEPVLHICKNMGVVVYGLSMARCDADAVLFDMYCTNHIRLPNVVEGDAFNLVPTASVIAFMVFLDAICMELMDIVMDKPEQFKAIHTGGTIGKN